MAQRGTWADLLGVTGGFSLSPISPDCWRSAEARPTGVEGRGRTRCTVWEPLGFPEDAVLTLLLSAGVSVAGRAVKAGLGILLGVEGRSLKDAAASGGALFPPIISAISALSPSRSSAGLWERRDRGSDRLTLDSSLSLEEAHDGDLTPRPAGRCLAPTSEFSAEPESDSSLYTKEEFFTRRLDGVSSASAVLMMVVVCTRGLGACTPNPMDVEVFGSTALVASLALVSVFGLTASLFLEAVGVLGRLGVFGLDGGPSPAPVLAVGVLGL